MSLVTYGKLMFRVFEMSTAGILAFYNFLVVFLISWILPPVFTVFSRHLERRLSPQGLDPLKPFLKFILARSATAPSYNMVLIITSIKSNKPSFSTTPYI